MRYLLFAGFFLFSGCGGPQSSFESLIRAKRPDLEKMLEERSEEKTVFTLEDIRFDVTKTDSIVSPLLGTVWFDIRADFPESKSSGVIHLKGEYLHTDDEWRFKNFGLEEGTPDEPNDKVTEIALGIHSFVLLEPFFEVVKK